MADEEASEEKKEEASEAEEKAGGGGEEGEQTGIDEVVAEAMEGEGGEVNLETVYEIPVQVTVVLGSATMPISQLLKLGRGAVIELNRKVGESVEVFVNDRLIARGEVVIVEDRIGITMTEIIKSDKQS